MTESSETRCSFCRKTVREVDALVMAWPESPVYICNECVTLSVSILAERQRQRPAEAQACSVCGELTTYRLADYDQIAKPVCTKSSCVDTYDRRRNEAQPVVMQGRQVGMSYAAAKAVVDAAAGSGPVEPTDPEVEWAKLKTILATEIPNTHKTKRFYEAWNDIDYAFDYQRRRRLEAQRNDAAKGLDDHALAGMLEYLARAIDISGASVADEDLSRNAREARNRARWLRERAALRRPDAKAYDEDKQNLVDQLSAATERIRELEAERCDPPPAWAIVAWVWDRREQYAPSSGTYEGISKLMGGLARGEYVDAWKHGELDDLKEDALRVLRGGQRRAAAKPGTSE